MTPLDGAIYALNLIINTPLPGTPWRNTYTLVKDLERYRDKKPATWRNPHDRH